MARPVGRVLLPATLVVLTGCTATGSLFGGNTARNPQTAATSAESGEVDTGGLSAYLELMQQLIDGDALTRAEAFSDAENDAAYAPTTQNRLRYALALSVPGHAGSDPAAAAERLRGLIASGGALFEAERMLATVQLHNAEQFMILEGSSIRLQERLDAAVAARDAEAAELIRGLQADNERLKSELLDATAMLDAISSIEESISEREIDEN